MKPIIINMAGEKCGLKHFKLHSSVQDDFEQEWVKATNIFLITTRF
ncbi:MAG: hypothetical protein V3U88_11370 [Methylococcales bacterium]